MITLSFLPNSCSHLYVKLCFHRDFLPFVMAFCNLFQDTISLSCTKYSARFYSDIVLSSFSSFSSYIDKFSFIREIFSKNNNVDTITMDLTSIFPFLR